MPLKLALSAVFLSLIVDVFVVHRQKPISIFYSPFHFIRAAFESMVRKLN